MAVISNLLCFYNNDDQVLANCCIQAINAKIVTFKYSLQVHTKCLQATATTEKIFPLTTLFATIHPVTYRNWEQRQKFCHKKLIYGKLFWAHYVCYIINFSNQHYNNKFIKLFCVLYFFNLSY